MDTVDQVFRPSSETMPEGHIELRIKTRGTNLLVHAVSGHGDVISNDRIVSLNTQLDSDEISSCTIITLGEFDDAATKLVDRLRARKPIQAIDRPQFETIVVYSINKSSGCDSKIIGPVNYISYVIDF